MNSVAENGDRFNIPFGNIRFPTGFEVCWVGPHSLPSSFSKGLCFGSLDGRILFTDADGLSIRFPGTTYMDPKTASDSQEAINGVACLGTWVVATTRQEVNFWPLLATEEKFAFAYGAHGITTTPSGYFIAPLGRVGIMAVQPPFSRKTAMTGYSFADLYAYRAIGLRSQTGGDVLACACRLGGIAAGEFPGAQQKLPMTAATFKGLDIVDVSPLDPGASSLAVAALGRDGTLVLSQDVLHDKKPFTMKFSSVKGTAYRVLSCRGDLIILTSKGIYVLGKLADRFLAKELVRGISTPVLPLLMEAVDVNLAANRWLLVVAANEVRKFDADIIHQSVPQQLGNGEFQEFQETTLNPDWKRSDIEQTTKQFAAVA